MDGQTVTNPADVVSGIERRGVGQTVALGIKRGEETLTIKVRPVDLAALVQR